MTLSEREKMARGQWYCCIDPELEELRARAREAVHEHNTLPPKERGAIGAALRNLLLKAAPDAIIEAPFHCAYGMNIVLGQGVYLNAGCTILDTASVRIGEATMLGPNVQIYCAEHHKDPVKRRAGLEIAKPIDIGENVWIGGGAMILGGVRIGDRAIVGAGAVVTKDVAANTTATGNPARPHSMSSFESS
ncbi:MAG: sugar O-acetyltransferase [Geminicoccaceae bacterium]